MSMTDGHIYFDHELYNRGRRPAINPFLSVTRVGHQTRSVLLKSLSQQVTSFLVHHEKLTKLTHFGEELSGDARKILALGERIIAFFDQPGDVIVPMTVAAVFLTSIWSGMWDAVDIPTMKANLSRMVNAYYSDPRLKETLDSLLSSAQTLPQLTEAIKTYQALIMGTQSEPSS
jgi:F-type H+-transporting ATPase subunit alpha